MLIWESSMRLRRLGQQFLSLLHTHKSCWIDKRDLVPRCHELLALLVRVVHLSALYMLKYPDEHGAWGKMLICMTTVAALPKLVPFISYWSIRPPLVGCLRTLTLTGLQVHAPNISLINMLNKLWYSEGPSWFNSDRSFILTGTYRVDVLGRSTVVFLEKSSNLV
jgi:hypothetical protein